MRTAIGWAAVCLLWGIVLANGWEWLARYRHWRALRCENVILKAQAADLARRCEQLERELARRAGALERVSTCKIQPGRWHRFWIEVNHERDIKAVE